MRIGVEQREPLGDGAEGERRDPWGTSANGAVASGRARWVASANVVLSFLDQVAQHALRISLREQVVTQDPDPELVDALAKRNIKMHTKEDEDPKEGAKVFHPELARPFKKGGYDAGPHRTPQG